MTPSRSALLNRQLSQAHALADMLRAGGQTPRALVHALEEGLVFQIVLSYRRLLSEVAEKLGASAPVGYLNAAGLAAHLEAQGRPAAILWQCRRLEDEGWIGEMLREFEQCGQSSPADVPRKRDSDLIARSGNGTRAARKEEWLSSLDALVEELREALAEW